jgi:hydroxypyruvate isomerase
MPRFAANLTLLFNEVEFLDRFEAARRAGFDGVEYLFPYAFEKDVLAGKLRRHELAQVLHNLPAGDWAKGERGIGCLPDRVGEFQDGVGVAIAYAKALGCPQLNCLAGILPRGVDPARAEATLVENLRFAARALAQEGLRLLIEPINTRDIPGFFLCHTDQALRIIERVGEPNLMLQYDAYHMQVMEGDLTATLLRHRARIGHVQVADNPGRHEPGTGEVHYPFVFAELDRAGYQGWIGCEYKPLTTTEAGLGWLAPYRRTRA